MRKLAFIFSLILELVCRAQEFVPLEKLEKWDTIPRGMAVIYGSFIWGVGITREGSRLDSVLSKASIARWTQFVHIRNIETGKLYTMLVKFRNRERVENSFLYVVQPGKYEIIDYRYSQGFSQGGYRYGGTNPSKTYTLNIYPHDNNRESGIEKYSPEGEAGDFSKITYEVKERTLNYVGTWDFRTSDVSFEFNKDKSDEKLKKYRKLVFASARIAIPQPTRGFLVPINPILH